MDLPFPKKSHVLGIGGAPSHAAVAHCEALLERSAGGLSVTLSAGGLQQGQAGAVAEISRVTSLESCR